MSYEVYSVPVDFPSQIDQLPNRGFEVTFLTLKENVHIRMLELKEFNLLRIWQLTNIRARTRIQVSCLVAQYPPTQKYCLLVNGYSENTGDFPEAFANQEINEGQLTGSTILLDDGGKNFCWNVKMTYEKIF